MQLIKIKHIFYDDIRIYVSLSDSGNKIIEIKYDNDGYLFQTKDTFLLEQIPQLAAAETEISKRIT